MVVALFHISLGSAVGAEQENQLPILNPHMHAGMCDSCHTSSGGGAGTLRLGGDVTQLCQWCHDGRRAGAEGHPVGLKPSEAMVGHIPAGLPLVDGKVGCSTCHDVKWGCGIAGRNGGEASFLRGGYQPYNLAFCYRCHAQEYYRPFNAHDQIEGKKAKTDTCLWCHERIPQLAADLRTRGDDALREKASGVCGNCHPMAKGHPGRGVHMGVKPPAEMSWYMSAYEMQSKMRMSLVDLLDYVRSAKRLPRSIPLDKDGRLDCYSCHNPHEKGLLPVRNPRSTGAEGKRATNHRLRAREGNMCVVCHQK